MSSRKRLQAGEIELILNSESDAYYEEEETLVQPFLAAASPQQQQPSSNWGPPSGTNKCGHIFIRHPHGKNNRGVPHINSEYWKYSCCSLQDCRWWRQSLLPAILGCSGRQTLVTS
jgi:hypothetical protein